ncbi:MAG: hypothetical protein MHPSP_003989, partial [Paramarteilia canceri]
NHSTSYYGIADDKNSGKFSAINANYFYLDNNPRSPYHGIGCPPGSIIYSNTNYNECIKCDYGKTNERIDNHKCDECLPNFQKINNTE